MTERSIIVIGASAGGIQALKDIAGSLPGGLPAPILVAMHVSADFPSHLPAILENAGPLPAHHALDGEALEPATIYVAPPDRHMIVADGHVRVLRGPKENGHRPAIDPLFRSAAWMSGSAAIGVILSGTMSDGAAGLWSIKMRGGVTVVQAPEDARYAELPMIAMRQIDVDHSLSARDIAGLLVQLTRHGSQETPGGADPNLLKEVSQNMRGFDLDDPQAAGALSAFTCPGCGGALWELSEGVLRYRCHTGHAFSADSFLEQTSEVIEHALYSALRALKEKAGVA